MEIGTCGGGVSACCRDASGVITEFSGRGYYSSSYVVSMLSTSSYSDTDEPFQSKFICCHLWDFQDDVVLYRVSSVDRVVLVLISPESFRPSHGITAASLACDLIHLISIVNDFFTRPRSSIDPNPSPAPCPSHLARKTSPPLRSGRSPATSPARHTAYSLSHPTRSFL